MDSRPTTVGPTGTIRLDTQSQTKNLWTTGRRHFGVTQVVETTLGVTKISDVQSIPETMMYSVQYRCSTYKYQTVYVGTESFHR